ncbi:MAG: glycosyltransferase family 4 protein [Clostridia bacterium]|nr:glycosyltransferase family 4 protein [Clostridia bacterium]
MNIVFLTIGRMNNIEDHTIYSDLLREFRNNGHNIYVVSANEKRSGGKTEIIDENGVHILRVKIGNITKCGLIEKGISTLKIEGQFIRAIKKYFKDVKFDLVMYSTPPITFAKVVKFIKKRDNAKSYLLLKDIFPQNAIDIGMLTKSGVKGFIYRFFRKKEKDLYAFSDKIGCMSQANCEYILKNNPEIDASKVEVCPNSIQVQDLRLNKSGTLAMRKKYDLPVDKKILVYGGNLGKPQGIPFLIDCLKSQEKNDKAFFLIIGSGTEFGKLESYFEENKPQNMKLMKSLPKSDYDKMVAACDVGMIFLDHRFTIPNFPSRLLAYMQAGVPVLACTDPNTDVGQVIEQGGFGWWCESNDVAAFDRCVNIAANLSEDGYRVMQNNALGYLKDNYSVENAYNVIMSGVER